MIVLCCPASGCGHLHVSGWCASILTAEHTHQALYRTNFFAAYTYYTPAILTIHPCYTDYTPAIHTHYTSAIQIEYICGFLCFCWYINFTFNIFRCWIWFLLRSFQSLYLHLKAKIAHDINVLHLQAVLPMKSVLTSARTHPGSAPASYCGASAELGSVCSAIQSVDQCSVVHAGPVRFSFRTYSIGAL